MAERLIVIINHQKHRLVERVDYITSPGHLDGGDARKRAGLPGGGPAVVITDRAILRPHGPTNEFHLAAVHPGHTVEEVVENTGWHLRSMPDAADTARPTEAELAVNSRPICSNRRTRPAVRSGSCGVGAMSAPPAATPTSEHRQERDQVRGFLV